MTATTPNNFSSPVIYTVTAEDGTSQDYTVIVTTKRFVLKGTVGQSSLVAGTPLKVGYTINGGAETFSSDILDASAGAVPYEFDLTGVKINDVLVVNFYAKRSGTWIKQAYSTVTLTSSNLDLGYYQYNFYDAGGGT